MNEVLKRLNDDKNLVVFEKHNIISVYDDNFYDRSDFDAINAAQKKYLKLSLKNFNYEWSSGRVLESSLYPLKFLCPKPKTLMSSPYDILDFENKPPNSIFILTPTQTLGQLLKLEFDAVSLKTQAKALITKTPVNLLKLKDGLRDEPLVKLNSILSNLSIFQKKIISAPKFKNKRQLGSLF